MRTGVGCLVDFQHCILSRSLLCAQILPRYIVHFDDMRNPSPLHSSGGALLSSSGGAAAAAAAAAVPAAQQIVNPLVVLWIDADTTRARALSEIVREMNAQVAIEHVTSSAEARAWLQRDAEAVQQLVAQRRLRVVNSRHRDGDGDELAGLQWIEWMRGLSGGSAGEPKQRYDTVPVLLHCTQQDYPRVSGLHEPTRRVVPVVVTYNEWQVVEFGSFRHERLASMSAVAAPAGVPLRRGGSGLMAVLRRQPGGMK